MTVRTLDRPPAGRLLIGLPAAAFVLLAAVVIGDDDGPIPRFDVWVSGLAHAYALAHPLWLATMAAATVAGSAVVVGPLAALGCVILVAVGHWRRAVFVAVALLVTLGARLVVVTLLHRPRPADQLAPASNYSFPSGHSTASAAAALILVLVCWPFLRRRWSRILLVAVAAVWAVTVGVSRVALVVHWPSDVVGAWLLVLVTVPGVALAIRRVPLLDDGRLRFGPGRGARTDEDEQ